MTPVVGNPPDEVGVPAVGQDQARLDDSVDRKHRESGQEREEHDRPSDASTERVNHDRARTQPTRLIARIAA
jgi:hypothetical protein